MAYFNPLELEWMQIESANSMRATGTNNFNDRGADERISCGISE
jgi:hypothetical protein